MKIVFLCGSLEPGRDGVGDYIRRLGGAIAKEGHQVAIVAIKDYYAKEAVESVQTSEGSALKVLRVPRLFSAKETTDLIKNFVNEFSPDWISLQFVLYAYHEKGIPMYLPELLKTIGRHKKWHFMFHEIWVGINKGAPLKLTLLGVIQKQFIKSIIKRIKPAVIHTQSNLYKGYLKNLGFESSFLPLFSNIPKVVALDKSGRNGHIDLVMFGTIHPNAPVEQFAKEMSDYSIKHSESVRLSLVGLCGPEETRWKKAFETLGMKVSVYGPQSVEKISEVLGNSTYGVSTSAFPMIEKSGTVVAMLDHGLPVICVANQWKQNGIAFPGGPKGVFEYKEGSLESFIQTEQKEIVVSELRDVANKLISTLEKN
jgi:hypothetical protein